MKSLNNAGHNLNKSDLQGEIKSIEKRQFWQNRSQYRHEFEFYFICLQKLK